MNYLEKRKRGMVRSYMLPVSGVTKPLFVAYEYDHVDGSLLHWSVLRQADTGMFFVNCAKHSPQWDLVHYSADRVKALRDHAKKSFRAELLLATVHGGEELLASFVNHIKANPQPTGDIT